MQPVKGSEVHCMVGSGRKLSQFVNHLQVLADGVGDVGQCLRLGIPLRVAPGQPRDGDGEPLVRLLNKDGIFYGESYAASAAS